MEIETQRLLLRPYTEEDLEPALTVLGDAKTMNFYPKPYSRERVRALIAKNERTLRLSRYGLMAVCDRESGQYRGDCGITIQGIDGRYLFEVGYRIGRESWGLGYAPEAAAAVVAYGFDQLQLPALYSYMPSAHQQSRRVAEKIGMRCEKEYLNRANRDVMTSVYAIRRGTHHAAIR